MRWVAFMLILGLVACASVTSEPVDPISASIGPVYHLPRRDVKATIAVSKVGSGQQASLSRQLTVTPGDAYADLSTAYLLQFHRNPIGEAKLELHISADGLLGTTNTSTTPKLVEALNAIVDKLASKATVDGPPPPAEDPRRDCAEPGTYVFVIPVPTAAQLGARLPRQCHDDRQASSVKQSLQVVEGKGVLVGRGDFCGASKVSVDVYAPAELFACSPDSDRSYGTVLAPNEPSAADKARPGVYYRQSIPLRVEVQGAGVGDSTHIVLSPSLSPARFLPIERTAFADSKADIGLVLGELKSFTPVSQGEIPALLTLPAAVLKAYFAAVGAVFSGFEAKSEAEADAVNARLQLDLAKRKVAACTKAAAASADMSVLEALGCFEQD
ncbi:MAG: hypothetical protein HYZ20_13270 [Burkholderiales bacterium]|nr:hypothetical protein [Burkholderiales bacterium]